MKSVTTRRFRDCYNALPGPVQQQADTAYVLWQQNPAHPSLKFKRLQTRLPIVSVRIGRDWRALGVQKDDIVIWFWIGSHAEYNHLVSRL